MWQRFTERARKAIFYAQEEAQRFGTEYVSTEHMLLGLFRDGDSSAMSVLNDMGISWKDLKEEVEKHLPSSEWLHRSNMTLTPRAKRVIDLAYDEARDLGHNYIGSEHLLLGLIREGDGLAGKALSTLGVTLSAAHEAVLKIDREKPRPSVASDTLAPRTHPVAHKATDNAFLVIRQNAMTPEWVFLLAVADEAGVAAKALRNIGLNVNILQTAVEAKIKWANAVPSATTFEHLVATAEELAVRRNQRSNTGYIVAAILTIMPNWLGDQFPEANLESFLDEVEKLGE